MQLFAGPNRPIAAAHEIASIEAGQKMEHHWISSFIDLPDEDVSPPSMPHCPHFREVLLDARGKRLHFIDYLRERRGVAFGQLADASG